MKELIDLLKKAAHENRIVLDPPGQSDAAPALRELAAFSAGLHWRTDESASLSWVGPCESEYLQDCPGVSCMDIGHDVCGNAWVLLFDSRGTPAEVLWACHDPFLLLVASTSLEEFLRDWTADPEAMTRRVEDRSRESPAPPITREQGLTSADRLVREFATSLDEQRWSIHDLRPGNAGRWFERDPEEPLRKHPDQLLFARVAAGKPPAKPWWKFWGP